MFQVVGKVLSEEPRSDYALVFGSCARDSAHSDSDLDVAIGVSESLDVHEIGDLIGRLESATGRALVRRKARAVLEYLDFKPIEDLCTRGVLAAARHGR